MRMLQQQAEGELGAMHGGGAFAFLRSYPASNQTASHAAEKHFHASDKMSLGACRSRQDLDQHWRPACPDRTLL